MARKLERMALDAAALASNLREASMAMPGTIGSGAGGGRGSGGGSFDVVLRRLDTLGAMLGQVSANVSGTAAAYRLAERQGGG